jgi:hypothetical protein
MTEVTDFEKENVDDILDKLKLYFKKSESKLLTELKTHNNIDNLIFQGYYTKRLGADFGFFLDIMHQDGNIVKYPISDEKIDKIYVSANDLTIGKRYLFEVTLANKFEREKQHNPFLLQANKNNVKYIEELTDIVSEINKKSKELTEIKSSLSNIELEYETKKKQLEEKVNDLLTAKKKEANEVIEEYNQTIVNKYQEIENRNKELMLVTESLEKTKNKKQKWKV